MCDEFRHIVATKKTLCDCPTSNAARASDRSDCGHTTYLLVLLHKTCLQVWLSVSVRICVKCANPTEKTRGVASTSRVKNYVLPYHFNFTFVIETFVLHICIFLKLYRHENPYAKPPHVHRERVPGIISFED